MTKINQIVAQLVAVAAALPFIVQFTQAQPAAAAKDGPKDFYFPSTGVSVEKQAILLGIDDYLLPLRENVGQYVSTPKYRKEAIVRPSRDNPAAPDQVA